MAVTLRKYPYPYMGMLAINSDIDRCTLSEFEEIHRFLNTKEQTSIGEGLGLDIADSFWFYNKQHGWVDELPAGFGDTMCYCQGTDINTYKDKEKIIKYLYCGWIDTMHTYGNFNTAETPLWTRKFAIDAMKDLSLLRNYYGIQLRIWSDHGDSYNTQGFASGNSGGVFSSQSYHLDITREYGVKFGWGPHRTGSFGKESMLTPTTFTAGTNKMWVFDRFIGMEPYPNYHWVGNMLDLQLTQSNLDKLKTDGLYEIVAQHMGCGLSPKEDIRENQVFIDNDPIFPLEVQAALQNLKAEQDAGNILVARSVRLLNYNLAQLYVQWSYDTVGDKVVITTIADPQFGSFVPTINDVRGLTFEGVTADSKIFIGQTEVADVSYPAVGVAMINWFTPDYTDYTQLNLSDLLPPINLKEKKVNSAPFKTLKNI